MTRRNLLKQWLDERVAPTPQTWAGIEGGLARRRRGWWVAAAVGATAFAVLTWARHVTPAPPESAEMYLFIAQNGAPASEALELHLKEAP
jgi:hypothetical protein